MHVQRVAHGTQHTATSIQCTVHCIGNTAPGKVGGSRETQPLALRGRGGPGKNRRVNGDPTLGVRGRGGPGEDRHEGSSRTSPWVGYRSGPKSTRVEPFFHVGAGIAFQDSTLQSPCVYVCFLFLFCRNLVLFYVCDSLYNSKVVDQPVWPANL